jgi:hypothetical protein
MRRSDAGLHCSLRGAIAQLGERLDRTQEVAGSSPASSIEEALETGPFSYRVPFRRPAEVAVWNESGTDGGLSETCGTVIAMSRENGHANLVASHPGNVHAAKHGVYSPRLREPRAREIADEILEAPHVSGLDEIGAVEIGRLEALIETLDEAIASAGPVNARRGTVRAVVELRLRASKRLQEWLDRYGMTPKGRAEWAKDLGRRGLMETVAERLKELDGRGA